MEISMKFTLLVIPFMREYGEEVPLAGRDSDRFQNCMNKVRDQMVFAESLGFNGFCLTEHHMQSEGIEATTNPIMWDMYVAQHTKEMRVGQLGMNLTAMNPIKVAEDIAMLDQMTGGRAFAGFSRGNTPRWTATMGQHIDITSTESDKSEADMRNRRAFVENWNLVKSLWTDDLTSHDGEFWKVPLPVDWTFNPTKHWGGDAVDENGILRKVGITPRPLQNPHPPAYAPFSYSMETARFCATEGIKMVSFVTQDKEEFTSITIDQCREAAIAAGRSGATKDIVALGGQLITGDTLQDSERYEKMFNELWSFAYDAPPYHVPKGRMWTGSRQQIQDDVMGLLDRYEIDEIFIWHHVGYFGDEIEKGALQAFADAVIEPLKRQQAQSA
jgi:alkanesulfonate monooxygenase SsuD/methylene tetrahydromethanopterin reductase-like flavin-dependent oxidoreductase (luciferase family)